VTKVCRAVRSLWVACICAGLGTVPVLAVAEPIAPPTVRVMIVSMFGVEAAPWRAALGPTRDFDVPGLPADAPAVRCTANGICHMIAGMGHANAAISMAALVYGGRLDLRKTYFLVAGIAGIDPAHGTIGSVAWARYAIDTGIVHEIDPRESPAAWSDGHFGLLTDSPDHKPGIAYGTEVFRLDEALLQWMLEISRSVTLADSPDVLA
jgi:purine nucleoside permease